MQSKKEKTRSSQLREEKEFQISQSIHQKYLQKILSHRITLMFMKETSRNLQLVQAMDSPQAKIVSKSEFKMRSLRSSH